VDRIDKLNAIYAKKKLFRNFDYDSMYHPPISQYLTTQDIAMLHKIAMSAKYNGRISEKIKMMDDIMRSRGFTRFHSGTNRLVYKSEFDSSIVIKVGMDKVGITDNPAEYYAQEVLKPFCCKVFEVSPCGTVAMIERVTPILNRQQFEEVADEVFYTIAVQFSGLVMEDIGCKFFMNWGLREGFGPVILDFPYTYAMDVHKMHCTHKEGDFECDGLIDYDIGFNTLICEKCGSRYTARELGKISKVVSIKERLSQLEKEGAETMIEKFEVAVERNGKSFAINDTSTDVFIKTQNGRKPRHVKTDDDTFIATAVLAKDKEPEYKLPPMHASEVPPMKEFEPVNGVKPRDEYNREIDAGLHDVVLPDGRRMRPNKLDEGVTTGAPKIVKKTTTLDLNQPQPVLVDATDAIETGTAEAKISGKARIMRDDINAFIDDNCESWMDKFADRYNPDELIKMKHDMSNDIATEVNERFSIDMDSATLLVNSKVDEAFQDNSDNAVSKDESDPSFRLPNADPGEIQDAPRPVPVAKPSSRIEDF